MRNATLAIPEIETDLETCDHCGCDTETTDGGLCPDCQVAQEIRDAVQAESDQAESDLADAEEEIQSLLKQLTTARQAKATAKALLTRKLAALATADADLDRRAN